MMTANVHKIYDFVAKLEIKPVGGINLVRT